jgi:hypothetical protein
MRQRIAYALLTVSAVVAALGIAAPGPRRVNIRWAPSATLAARVAAAQELGVRSVMSREERTWSYGVPDAGLIPKIIQHPLVEDTHHIDRAEATFSPELPPARAAVRRLYEGGPLAAIAAGWQPVSAILCVLGLVLAWPAVRASASAPSRLLIGAILVVSLALRVMLVMSGGQFYWPDEDRYRQSRDMVEASVAGDTQAVWTRAMASGHPLFKVLGMLPAAVEWKYGRDPRIPAVFFAVFGALNIWLLACVARRFGANEGETLLAAVLFAASTSFLYYARHLFPYDVAMTFGLLALHAAASAEAPAAKAAAKDGGWRSWLACGGWAACAFLTYFGYWAFGGAGCVVCVLGGASWKDSARRAVVAGAGLAAPLLALSAASAAMSGSFASLLREFSGQVTQGSVAEGWWLPFEYLWHTEHLLLVVWIAAVGWCVATWPSWRNVRSVRAGLIGLLCVYGALAILSTGLGVFVVYGRLARQLVPFFCLVTAAVLVRISVRRPSLAHVLIPAVAAAVVLQAAFNARQVFAQQFPPEFIANGEQAAGRQGASRAASLYTEYTYPPVKLEVPADSVEVMSASHPLQFVPYQYEGFTPDQRRFLRSTDMRMRILVPAGKRNAVDILELSR